MNGNNNDVDHYSLAAQAMFGNNPRVSAGTQQRYPSHSIYKEKSSIHKPATTIYKKPRFGNQV